MIVKQCVLFSGGSGSREAVRWAMTQGGVIETITFVPDFPASIEKAIGEIAFSFGTNNSSWVKLNDGSGGSMHETPRIISYVYPVAIPGVLEEDAIDLFKVMDSAGATAFLKAKILEGFVTINPEDSVVVGHTIDHFFRDADMDRRMLSLSAFLSEQAGGHVSLVFPNESLRKPSADGSIFMWRACTPEHKLVQLVA